ncbi:helix-turn-helix domain-containing protein [Actinacidiphila acidipaludis]|uniref:Helix-turn-helix domain-containing protein n=1 Tax=Actinacidiphila acidipaludis TaxID=2873382 RepID=A0ABS7QIB2_9ACTN|nr:helix-turn-helix domain-containing protein [Streptomyces acidipaludis]MBY8882906.1 helix-turn-helix domain-containing protein [Streptomyces acidipaludis]
MTTFHPATAHAHDGAAPGTDHPPFGELLRGHRLRVGLTQRELADLSTVSMRAIRNLEQGRAQRPRPDTVRLIADALRLGERSRGVLQAAARQRQPETAEWPAELLAPPTALHPALGREAETEVLAQELSSGVERLVTVVGLSGIGKTRLAQAVAERLHTEGMPVLWHSFPEAEGGWGIADDPSRGPRTGNGQPAVRAGWDHTAAGSPGGVSRTLASPSSGGVTAAGHGSLGRTAGSGANGDGTAAGTRPGDRSPATLLRECAEDLFRTVDRAEDGTGGPAALLGERPALLVLDGAPPRGVRHDRLSRLLRACPELRLLVTCEEPWGVPGERVFLLAPLGLPAPDRADGEAPAVRMFLSHARRVRPDVGAAPADLAHVASLCRALDGHPTALACAASWLLVHDATDLAAIAGLDPASLLDDLTGGDDGRRVRQAVERVLLRLPAGHRALLDAVCARGGAEFELADVMALTGGGPADSGRMLRDLLVHGVIRSSYDSGRSRFRVLGLVRALHGTSAEAGSATAEDRARASATTPEPGSLACIVPGPAAATVSAALVTALGPADGSSPRAAAAAVR